MSVGLWLWCYAALLNLMVVMVRWYGYHKLSIYYLIKFEGYWFANKLYIVVRICSMCRVHNVTLFFGLLIKISCCKHAMWNIQRKGQHSTSVCKLYLHNFILLTDLAINMCNIALGMCQLCVCVCAEIQPNASFVLCS